MLRFYKEIQSAVLKTFGSADFHTLSLFHWLICLLGFSAARSEHFKLSWKKHTKKQKQFAHFHVKLVSAGNLFLFIIALSNNSFTSLKCPSRWHTSEFIWGHFHFADFAVIVVNYSFFPKYYILCFPNCREFCIMKTFEEDLN